MICLEGQHSNSGTKAPWRHITSFLQLLSTISGIYQSCLLTPQSSIYFSLSLPISSSGVTGRNRRRSGNASGHDIAVKGNPGAKGTDAGNARHGTAAANRDADAQVGRQPRGVVMTIGSLLEV